MEHYPPNSQTPETVSWHVLQLLIEPNGPELDLGIEYSTLNIYYRLGEGVRSSITPGEKFRHVSVQHRRGDHHALVTYPVPR